jgi:hypothetical protein
MVEPHLRISGAGGKRAEDERRAALLAAEACGDLVELADREHDHRGSRRELAEALRLGVAEGRQPGPRGEGRIREKLAEQRADGLGAEEPRLETAPCVLDAVREHVAPLAVGGELDLVHREEVHLQVEGHRLDRAHPVGRPPREDALLAGDQCDRLRSPQRGDAVVVLPRQEPKGKADHPGAVREHPLDGEVRLPGVGGAQEGRNRAVHGPGPPAWCAGAAFASGDQAAVPDSSAAGSGPIQVAGPSGRRVLATRTGMPASSRDSRVRGCSTFAPARASAVASA